MKRASALSKATWILPVVFFAAFLLYTPLDAFESWIPAGFHRGYYSILRMDPGDDTAFYSFLRSTYFDHDLDFSNEEWLETTPSGTPALRGFFQAHHLTKTGYVCALTHGIGAGLLWLPFLAAGQAISELSEHFGWHITGGPAVLFGYRIPEMLATGIGSACLVLCGLVLIHQTLRRRFSAWISLTIVLAILLTSELPYYAFIRSRMAHAGEFFVFAICIWFWEKIFRREEKPLDYLFLACAFGYLTLTRLNDVLYLGLPVGLLAWRAWESRTKGKPAAWRKAVQRLALFTGILALSMAPMFVALKIIFGGFWPVDASGIYRQLAQEHAIFAPDPAASSTYSIFSASFVFGHFQFLRAIVTPLFGLAWSTPFVLLGWVGLGFLVKKERPRGLFFLVGYLPIFLLYHARLGDDYGHRYLLPTWYFLGYGVAALLEAAEKKWRTRRVQKAVYGILILLAGWSYVLLLQYKTVLAYNEPLYCWKALLNLPYIGGAIPLWRSTSLPGILFTLGGFRLASGLDWLMLVLLPLVAFGAFLGGSFLLTTWTQKGLPKRFSRLLVATYVAALLACSAVFWLQNKRFTPDQIVERLQTHANVLLSRWPSRLAHHRTGLYLLKLALDIRPADAALHEKARQAAEFLAQQYAARHETQAAADFEREALALSTPLER